MADLRPRRSVLFLPASRASAVARARTVDADCVILDLEDAVAPDAKAAARDAAVAALATGDWGHRERLVRVNGLGSAWVEADFAAARGRVDAVVVPKLNSADEARRAVELAAGTPVWAMIETPGAVIEAAAIAATPGIAALVAGFNDLAAELGTDSAVSRVPLHYAMGAIVVAARAAGVLAFDGVFNDIHDADGLRAEAVEGRRFGFDGKTVVHPDQLFIVNSVFAPTDEQLAAARGLIAAYEAAAADGQGVTTYNGRMIELLHVAAARRCIAAAEAIAAR